jgi:serine/threonine protein kinase
MMRKDRSFAGDIVRAVQAVNDAAGHDDIDAAVREAMTDMAALKLSAAVDPETLTMGAIIGIGGYGSVWVATDPKGKQYALKCLRKCLLAGYSELPKRALREKEALETLRHPFISRLYSTFQDADTLYFLLDLAPGGDLCTLLEHQPVFPEEWALFYTASLALALRHMHKHSFVYRDMKPENVLLDQEGFICLADMGFAKKVADRTFTACGTDEYVPPELLEGKGRTAAADWWGLGVLLHEMVTGRPPFAGRNTSEIFDKISTYQKGGDHSNEQLRLDLGTAITPSCAELISGFLVGDEKGRIGSGPEGFLRIQTHAWFSPINWGALVKREVAPPYVPPPFDPSTMDVEIDKKVIERRNFNREALDPILRTFGPYVKLPPMSA